MSFLNRLKPVNPFYATTDGGDPRKFGYPNGSSVGAVPAAAIEKAAGQFNPKKSPYVEQAQNFVYAELAAKGENPEESDEYLLIERIRKYKTMVEPEQDRIRAMFRRFDNLYDPQTFTFGGADHWPSHAQPGKTHISVNSPRALVDIPASLQALTPFENVLPNELSENGRAQAAGVERLYYKWLDEDDREVKDEIACQVKCLYGWTFGKVYWDAQAKMPRLQIIESPENLYVGWGASDYRRMDWAIYCYGLTPQAVQEDFGLDVAAMPAQDRTYVPYVLPADHSDPLATVSSFSRDLTAPGRRTAYDDLMVEVYDYWYKKPVGKGKVQIWNAIYVGNRLIENARHPEYDELPYLPLKNGSIPGSPYAPSELYDVEQLIREKDERLSEQAAMIHSIAAGQRWQLTGPDAPDEVPENALPAPNGVAAPGPGNRLEALQPFMPEFAIEDYIKRIDREIEVVSGLNELLLGTVPANSLNSSKAIAAMLSNYEARIARKRKLLYRWRRDVWEMAAKVWERKDSKVAKIIDGHYRLEIKSPELNPQDDLETANRAISLVQARIWSMRRAADATGVEDPEEEQNIIREEQTDASLNPASVLQQTQLMAGLQSLQQPPNQANEQQVAEAARKGANAQRQANRAPTGGASANSENGGGQTPNESKPGNTPEGQAAGAGGLLSQTLVGTNGQVSGRLLSQQQLG